MAIIGQQNINIGAENEAAGSDNLYQAFNKVQNNFTTLFNTASPYTSYVGNGGISTYADSSTGQVFITNTGVTSIAAGTGIVLSGTTGNVIISATGDGNSGTGTVTNVNVTSSTLNVSGAPIVSAGNIIVDLPLIPTGPSFAAGEYIAPTLTVDNYGRITEIANTVGVGTVTSVAIQAVGDGLTITNSPITSSGIIEITNTGVTKLNAGTGISLSGSSGEVTISSMNMNQGTVTRIEVTSNTLTVTGSPITSDGTINIEVPSNVVLDTFTANTIIANTDLNSLGNLTVDGNASINILNANTATANFLGQFDGVIGNDTPNVGNFTTINASANANVTGNIRANYVSASNEMIANQASIINGGALLFTASNTSNVSVANYTAFFGNPNPQNTTFVLPAVDGYSFSVLGTDGRANAVGYATLGWKTIVTQYMSVLLRNGTSTVFVPPTAQRRAENILLNDGTSFANVTLY
jgi:hypothetical protein